MGGTNESRVEATGKNKAEHLPNLPVASTGKIKTVEEILIFSFYVCTHQIRVIPPPPLLTGKAPVKGGQIRQDLMQMIY